MPHAIVYFDGGSANLPGKKNRNVVKVSWGIVASIEDQSVEVHGKVTHKKDIVGFRHHEMVALFESVMFVHNRGYKAHECSFYTDDQFISHSPAYLREENHLSSMRESVMNKLKTVASIFYPNNDSIVDLIAHYLKNANINWVKGHSGSVNNCRADYLVRYARQGGEFLTYDRWMKDRLANGGHHRHVLGSAFYEADRCHFRNMM
jgi:ribonuclease HI